MAVVSSGLARMRSRLGSSYWFVMAVVLILVFGAILAVVLALATKTSHTSNPPSKNTNNSSMEYRTSDAALLGGTTS